MTLQLHNGETVLQDTKYQRYDHFFKLLLLGDSNVGKTSLLHRFTDDTFNQTFVSTVGIDFKMKTLIKNNRKIKLQIWDTAGQERFHAITKAYIRGACGIILVYDVTNSDSFENLSKWMAYVMQFANDDVQRLIVGNKCDADDNVREVQSYKGRQAAHAYGAEFVEVSAKVGLGVEEAFLNLAERIFERHGGSEGRELTMSVSSVISLNDSGDESEAVGGAIGKRRKKSEIPCCFM